QAGRARERLQELGTEKRQQFQAERQQAQAAQAARHDQEQTDLAAEWDQRIATATEDLRPAKAQALAALRANQMQEWVQLDESMTIQQQNAWRAAWLPPAEEPVLIEQVCTSERGFSGQ